MLLETRSSAEVDRHKRSFAPKIYYFHPLLAGKPDQWERHLTRCRGMNFDHLLTAPLFAPGRHGDIFLTGNYERVHQAWQELGDADHAFADFSERCHQHELHLLVDIVLGRVATDAEIAHAHPRWFQFGDTSDLIDPRQPILQRETAYARFDNPEAAETMVQWWVERLSRLVEAGVSGFRCLDLSLVPSAVWRRIIETVRQTVPACRFLAWTPGIDWRIAADLRGCGFDAAFSSSAWWDGRASWFVEEYELLRGIGSVIASPEVPFGRRLARRPGNPRDLATNYKYMLHRAAATGTGMMIPMGYEFAASVDMDGRLSTADDFETAASENVIDLLDDVGAANTISGQLSSLVGNGEMRALNGPGEPVTVLLRSDTPDVRNARAPVVVVINSHLDRELSVPGWLDPLPPSAGANFTIAADLARNLRPERDLGGGEIRILQARRGGLVRMRSANLQPSKVARSSPRIVIDQVEPSVDSGRFAAKRIVGDSIIVEADVFADGHEILGVELQWRASDETDWRRVRMRPLGNDRWQAIFGPARVGRHEFTIEAWWDRYATLCRDIEVKRTAGVDIALEIEEGRQLIEEARHRVIGEKAAETVNMTVDRLSGVPTHEAAEVLLGEDLRSAMALADERLFHHRHEPALPLDIDRPQAAFSAWYELFPRSAGDMSGRHGTFDDVIRRLPAIREMGFDVLYFPPIHPIGTTNRKGRNNSLRAEDGDVGSPYAIGSREGGHTAIHPELGTLDDFRRLVDSAAQHGLELALDFAIQCSPDHPWLKQHPGWFTWRPDGSLRYAENPPKKYEDIVNVDFYQKDAIPGLWLALRDVILYWISEGVRIFRVDNPHTKPLPFWEWLITSIKASHPDAIFLAEAFTRPKMMYRLAKLGFSQSYTYFTWRNTKRELTDYLVELTTSGARDFFRPNFFVNTPDINPYFLQTSGRAGFLIRAALATTLSGNWGIYSGFEQCEAAALPGREEYLDSEKYEIRVRSYDAPGNITAEIAKLNHIRKSHPAMHSHLGLRFYSAFNEQILYYGKPLPASADMILVAVNLDPFQVQEATIEIPLWEWGLADDASVAVEDLMRGDVFSWHGKLQTIRLDPRELPFSIWRLTPHVGGV